MNTTVATFEQRSYEIDDLWKLEYLTQADLHRVSIVAEHIPTEVQTVLDVGCGNGVFLHHLAQRATPFARLCGVDRSTAALKYVQTEKHQASVESLPFRDREFDLVTCLEVIEHLPVLVYENARREISRTAAKYIVVSVPNNQDLDSALVKCPLCHTRYNPDFHMRSFDQKTLGAMFDDLGYQCFESFGIHAVRRLRWGAAVKRAIRRSIGGTVPPWFAICPMCGLESSHTRAHELVNRRESKTALMRAVLRTLWPKELHYQWIASVYVRRG